MCVLSAFLCFSARVSGSTQPLRRLFGGNEAHPWQIKNSCAHDDGDVLVIFCALNTCKCWCWCWCCYCWCLSMLQAALCLASVCCSFDISTVINGKCSASSQYTRHSLCLSVSVCLSLYSDWAPLMLMWKRFTCWPQNDWHTTNAAAAVAAPADWQNAGAPQCRTNDNNSNSNSNYSYLQRLQLQLCLWLSLCSPASPRCSATI